MDRIGEVAEEVGHLMEQSKLKLARLQLRPDQKVLTLEEAAKTTEADMPRDQYLILVDYWTTESNLVLKRQLLETLKLEAKKIIEAGGVREHGGRGRGAEGGGGGKKLDTKAVAQFKDSKYAGKDGGVGWSNFFEDLSVVMGSVDKDLEMTVKAVTDMKRKDIDDPEAMKIAVEGDLWERYSGELFARLMEITKEDAQKVVRNEGVKSGRCGFWALRKMMERFNPRSYMRLLKLLLKVIKPKEAKHVKEVQSAVEDWENDIAKLEEEYGETLNESIKVAILISMIPDDLQEKVFEIEKGSDEVKYQAAKDVVVSMALRRAEQRKPKEDELNAIELKRRQEEEDDRWTKETDALEEGWNGGYDYGERDVDAVGMGKGNPSIRCLRCGGVGHMARECASPWDMLGKGKAGGKFGGKVGKVGGFQGWVPGGVKGKIGGKGGVPKAGVGISVGSGVQKGKGKGYQGYCFDCGQQGHKRGEPACWMSTTSAPMDLSAVTQEVGKDLSAVEFGGGAIWEVAQVEVEDSPVDADEPPPLPEPSWMRNRGRPNTRHAAARHNGSAGRVGADFGLRCACQGCPQPEGNAGDEFAAEPHERQLGITSRIEVRMRTIEEELAKTSRINVDERFIGAVAKENPLMTMNFQVAGVKKALAAVSKICKAGNVVQFGEDPSECFIMNKMTKKKVMLKQRRGSYVIDAELVRKVQADNGEEKFETLGQEVITIDSGAEESVCPLGWGEVFGLSPVKPGREMRMINAGGGTMQHYGSRKVQFAAASF